MARVNRPTGREKRVGSGSARVGRRGSGLGGGGGSTGPVGGSGGFFQRKPTSGSSGSMGSSGPTSSTGPIFGGGSSGYGTSGNRGPSGGIGKLLVPLIVLAIAFYLFSKLGGGLDLNPGNGSSNGPGTEPGIVSYDQGAYAVDRTVHQESRPKYTTPIGNGEDQVTVMVYLLGTDLESRGAMATKDLQEMLDAELSDQVNIVVETGGTAQWQNNVMKSGTNQRFLINDKGLQQLNTNLGRRSMVDPATLTDFIRYSKREFPADRYFLILWDHGGGSVTGYGYDEYFKGQTMTLDEIERALFQADCKFDFVGFDACLMATLETAFVAEPYADYLIASEELEPGIGWHYTGWLDALSDNTSISTIDLGKTLIDDYISEVKRQTPKSQATLSLVDLAELGATVPPEFSRFSQNTANLIETENYKVVSDSRANTKEFAASTRINQIDLTDFALRLDTSEGKSLASALDGAVKYNRMSDNITNANGLSIFFPYGKLSDVDAMLSTYEEIGMDEDYTRVIKSFANLNAGGQMASQGGGLLSTLLGSGTSSQGTSTGVIGSLISAFLSQGDFSSLTGGSTQAPSWLDTQQVQESTQYYSETIIDPASITITNKDGERVLALTEKEWDQVHTMELSVFLDDGEGFIDLGRDNVFEYNDDGDLILEYDGTWLAVNDRIVCYYMYSYDAYGDEYKIMGRIPALLNNQRVNILVSFDQDNPYGEVLGAQILYDQRTETPNLPKGLLEIKEGDRIDYLCDYYSYDGTFDDTYFLGDPYYATGDWYIENLALEDLDVLTTYKITDIYGNSYWTPTIEVN